MLKLDDYKTMRVINGIIVAVILAVAALSVYAFEANADDVTLPSEDTLKVIYHAAKTFNVDAQDLIRIAYVESSFHADARRVNTNGTVDYGMFQINSVHWTTTCKAFNVFTLKGNALCAAKMIAGIKKHAVTDSAWIGRYHSKTPSRKHAYAAKLARLTFKGKE